MKTIIGTNVCEIFPEVMRQFKEFGKPEDSRNGKVLTFHEPIMVQYLRPTQRVLFSAKRDANPFFHLMEALWMLDGNNDSRFLDHYVKDFGDRYGENGFIHGAYGARWRNSLGFDQIKEVIRRLKENKLDRQCVLQMWDSSKKGCNDLQGNWLDKPCNTQIFLRIVDGRLDLNTTARSHDYGYGATGANIVHFSVLQEYLATLIGVGVGTFFQYSWNSHLYLNFLEILEKREGSFNDNRYDCLQNPVYPTNLIDDVSTFDEELHQLIVHTRIINETDSKATIKHGKNHFLWKTALPMVMTHKFFKNKEWQKMESSVKEIEAQDWRVAAYEWLERRCSK